MISCSYVGRLEPVAMFPSLGLGLNRKAAPALRKKGEANSSPSAMKWENLMLSESETNYPAQD